MKLRAWLLVFFLTACAFCAGALYSAEPASPLLKTRDAVLDLNRRFMEEICRENISEAFALIRPYMPVAGSEIETLASTTREQYAKLRPNFGAPLGYELLEEKPLQDCLLRYTYLEKRENFTLRWTIIYYRPREAWLPVILKWDANMLDLFR